MPKMPDIIPVTDLRQDAAAALKRVQIRAAKGYDLDDVLAEADRLLADP